MIGYFVRNIMLNQSRHFHQLSDLTKRSKISKQQEINKPLFHPTNLRKIVYRIEYIADLESIQINIMFISRKIFRNKMTLKIKKSPLHL